MSLKKQAISGIIWTLFQQFGVSGITFLVQILLARLIAPEEFGLYGLLLIFNVIGNSLSDSGMGQSIIRSDNLDETDYGTVFLTNLGISVFIYSIIVLCSPLIADFYDKPILVDLIWVYSLSIILTSFSTIQIYRLTKLMNFKRQAIIQIPSVLLSGLVGITMAYMDYGVWALVIMQLVQNLVLSIQYWLFTGWRPKLFFDREKFKEHLNFGYKLTVAGLLNNILNNIFPVVIGKFYTTADVGYFTRAKTMQTYPVQSITAALSKVTYPLFASAKNDPNRLALAFRKIQNMVFFLMSAMMLYFILVAEPLFLLLLGEEWLPAVPYFQLLCITGIFFPIHSYNLNIVNIYGRSDQFLTASVIKKTTLLIGIVLTVKIGIIALILSLVVNNFISLFVNMFYGAQHIDYPIPTQLMDMLQSSIPSGLSAVITFIIISFIPWNLNPYSLIALISLSFYLIFAGINLIFKTRNFTELINLIKDVKKNHSPNL